jgi:hypothetical protein
MSTCKRTFSRFFYLYFLINALLIGAIAAVPAERTIDRLPVIYPDYTDITLPPNIAPLNFIIQESGTKYMVLIESQRGKAIQIKSRSPKIQIPQHTWKKLLAENNGAPLRITISSYKDGQWNQFKVIENHIAKEGMDSHLAYRLIKPLYVYWNRIGIYDRDLTSFQEKPILLNKNTSDNCLNCHSFADHRPDRMLLHTRAGAVGTSMLLAVDDRAYKVDTATDFNRAVAYRSWHPSGKVIAFSANTVNQFFHATGENRDVYDKASDLLIYNVQDNMITSSPNISGDQKMETYPEWSPDGKYLYFCSTDGIEKYGVIEHPYNKIKYDLMRISYDIDTGTWGDVEPVLLSSEFGMSITHPKVSPDGRYLLFCMSEYGNFSIYRPDSDLYLLDLQTRQFHKVDILNSNKSESYHSWDSGGHWVVFSSKREDGICARPFFSHFNGNDQFSKPFILPQKDPEIYSRLLKTFNVPEFVNGAVKISGQKLLQAAWQKPALKAKLDPKMEKKKQGEADDEMYKQVGKN